MRGSNRPIHVFGSLRIDPAFEDQALAILHSLAATARREAGCLRFDLYRDAADPTWINLVGVFLNNAAIKQHLNSEHVKAAFGALEGKVVRAPRIRVLSSLNDGSGV